MKKSTKLGKGGQHRNKLLKSLASSVIVHEKIQTTEARA